MKFTFLSQRIRYFNTLFGSKSSNEPVQVHRHIRVFSTHILYIVWTYRKNPTKLSTSSHAGYVSMGVYKTHLQICDKYQNLMHFILTQAFRFMVGAGHCPMISKHGPSLSKRSGPSGPILFSCEKISLK